MNDPKKKPNAITEEIDRAMGADDTQPQAVAPKDRDPDVLVYLDVEGEIE